MGVGFAWEEEFADYFLRQYIYILALVLEGGMGRNRGKGWKGEKITYFHLLNSGFRIGFSTFLPFFRSGYVAYLCGEELLWILFSGTFEERRCSWRLGGITVSEIYPLAYCAWPDIMDGSCPEEPAWGLVVDDWEVVFDDIFGGGGFVVYFRRNWV